MDAPDVKLANHNVTFVFDKLNSSDVDSGEIKEALSAIERPVMLENPDMIVGLAQEAGYVVQVSQRRVSVTFQHEGGPELATWELAVRAAGAVPETSRLVAYGLNFSATVVLSGEDARAILRSTFVPDPGGIENLLGGELLGIVPQFSYQRGAAVNTITFNASDEQHMRVHLNAHAERPDPVIPTADDLAQRFGEELAHMREVVRKLIAGGR